MSHLLLLQLLLLLVLLIICGEGGSNLGGLVAPTRLSMFKRVPLEVINTPLQRISCRVLWCCGSHVMSVRGIIVMMIISFERADMYELPPGGRGTRRQACHIVRCKRPDLLPFITTLALASTCILLLLLRP